MPLTLGILTFTPRRISDVGVLNFVLGRSRRADFIAAFQIRPASPPPVPRRYAFSSRRSFRLLTCFFFTLVWVLSSAIMPMPAISGV